MPSRLSYQLFGERVRELCSHDEAVTPEAARPLPPRLLTKFLIPIKFQCLFCSYPHHSPLTTSRFSSSVPTPAAHQPDTRASSFTRSTRLSGFVCTNTAPASIKYHRSAACFEGGRLLCIDLARHVFCSKYVALQRVASAVCQCIWPRARRWMYRDQQSRETHAVSEPTRLRLPT